MLKPVKLYQSKLFNKNYVAIFIFVDNECPFFKKKTNNCLGKFLLCWGAQKVLVVDDKCQNSY